MKNFKQKLIALGIGVFALFLAIGVNAFIYNPSNTTTLVSGVTGNNPHVTVDNTTPAAPVIGYADTIPLTRVGFLNARTAGTLKDGWYEITNANGAQNHLRIHAEFTNSHDNTAWVYFANADFQNVGNYSGVNAQTGTPAGTRRGVWVAAGESGTYVNGDIVIYNTTHYQVTNSGNFNGTGPATNLTAYTALSKGIINLGYLTVMDRVIYDIDSDTFVYREDTLGNKVYGAPAITQFQWGNLNVMGNTIDKGSVLLGWNMTGTFSGNIISGGSTVNAALLAGSITNSTFTNGSSSTVNLDNVTSWIGNRVSVGTFTFPTNISYTSEVVEEGLSTFSRNLVASTNFAAGVLTFPSGYGFVGTINLTDAAGGNISSFAGSAPTLFPFRITNANGISNTILPILVGLSSAGNIVSSAGTFTLVGRTNGTDFAVFQSMGTLFERISNVIVL